ncbi:MAG: ATP-binding protein, partial [Planktothrix sp.]
MSSTQKPIPRLDLAPKLNRPLSLFNPLDYLRLLYWVFFFPQAIRWYLETFKQEKILRIQGFLLTVLTPLLISFILEQFGFSVNWWGVALSVVS